MTRSFDRRVNKKGLSLFIHYRLFTLRLWSSL